MKSIRQIGCLSACALILALSSCDKKDSPEEPSAETKTWNHLYGGNGNESGKALVKLSDGGYIVAGMTTSNNNGDVGVSKGVSDVWLVRVDQEGKIVWKRNYGGSDNDFATTLVSNPDGTITVAGYSVSNKTGDIIDENTSGNDIWVFKIDGSGNVIWSKLHNGADDDYAHSMVRTPDGGYLVTGYTNTTRDIDNLDMLILKLDANGNELWRKIIAEEGVEAALGAWANTDGTLMVAGYSSSSSINDATFNKGSDDAILMKLQSDGTVIWTKSYGGNDQDYLTSITTTADGGYALVGGTMSHNSGDVGANHGDRDCWVIKTDGNGVLNWQKTYGGTNEDLGNCIIRTPENGFLIAGNSFSNNSQSDGLLIKISASGELIKQKYVGGDDSDSFMVVSTASDGGFITIGETLSHNSGEVGSNKGDNDIWVVKFKDI